MELFPNGYDDGINVEFIRDIEVVHLIKDEPTQSKNTKKAFNNNSTDEDYSENESSVVLKPKALFEDGDVPGDRLFSFHSKQRTSTSQSNKLSQKTPTSNTKISNSIKITQQGKARQQNNTKDDNKKKSNTFARDLFGNEIEIKSRTHRKSTRATSKLEEKNESSGNDSESLTDSKFSFDTPKKSKNNHVHSIKVQNSSECLPKSTPKTPRSRKKVEIEQILTKTPRIVRKQIAKGIAYQKCEQLNELNDSDYSISDKSDESDSDSSIHSDVQIAQPVLKNKNISLRRSTRKKEVPFMYKSEEYFLSKSAKSLKKSKTSDNTLKLLKNPVLEKIQVDQLSVNSNNLHDKKLKALYKETISNFPYWLCLLKEGFNLLLYGFGSKRQIIDEFRISMLENESVLVINGFFPGLTLKEILESITIDLLDLESCPGNAELAIQQIEETQKLKTAEHIYILLHNLDGVELQNYKTQHVLSRISSLNNVHLIASIDRINAALMWDNTKLGDYNFIWMDCTNFSPYTVETSYIESLMVKNTGSVHAFSALSNVFKSLNSNSKQILLLLIKDRIENKNDKKYGGVPFSILYGWCRQRFLVSTDLALRSQLTEFVDHQLVKWKRDADVLYVPVDVDVLIKFYKQNEEDDE